MTDLNDMNTVEIKWVCFSDTEHPQTKSIFVFGVKHNSKMKCNVQFVNSAQIFFSTLSLKKQQHGFIVVEV